MDMLDYDAEARHYDASRGGEPRARAAADAVERLLPQGPCAVLDIACGTGIVTERLPRPGRTVVGVDRSPGMLGLAARRVPGGVVRGDATRLPFASDAVDAVVIVWLLHLLPDPVPVLAEAARVLRPGGVLITTVDKNDAYFAEDSDIAEATADLQPAVRAPGARPVRPAAPLGGGTGTGDSRPDMVPRHGTGPQPSRVARGDRGGPHLLVHPRAPGPGGRCVPKALRTAGPGHTPPGPAVPPHRPEAVTPRR